MKWIVKLLLFLFIIFLATPTVICMVEEEADVSACFSLSEEEESHSTTETKQQELKLVYESYSFLFDLIVLKKTDVTLVLSHENIHHEIVIPPPELMMS